MEGQFHDGLTARAHPVDVSIRDEALVFWAGGEDHVWRLGDLIAEISDDRARLARDRRDPARLVLAASDWRSAAGGAPGYRDAQHRREIRLVAGLAAAALSVAAVIFVLIPAAAGALAQRTPPALEQRLGATFDAQMSMAFPACGGRPGQADLGAFGARLGETAGTPFSIRIRAVHAPIANAFALPGGAVLVTDKLIAMAATPDELAAVLAHETAHVQRRDVMQALWRSFGFGLMLDAVVGGGTGAGQQAVLLTGSLTNLRYSRAAEAQADAAGQDMLQAAGLSSQGMAPFFRRMAAAPETSDTAAVGEVLSDHPDILGRAQTSAARGRPGAAAFSPAEWAAIKASCRDGYDPLKRLRNRF